MIIKRYNKNNTYTIYRFRESINPKRIYNICNLIIQLAYLNKLDADPLQQTTMEIVESKLVHIILKSALF